MICLSCKNLDLQSNPKHAALGVGKCSYEQMTGTFVSFNYRRDCKQHQDADAEVTQKRIEWWKSKE